MNFTMYTTTKETPWQRVESMPEAPCNTTLSFTGETDQVWEGFGGCFNELSQIAIETLPKDAQEEIYDALFKKDADGVRFDFCRLPIGASDYAECWYSHNETDGDYKMEHFSIERDEKYLIPYIKEAKKRNPELKLFASPWSPPTWMKTHKACNFGTLIQTDENLSAYALYFLKFVQAYKEKGLPIAQVHVQNEPMSTQKFPSCIWTGEEFARFIGKYLGPLFEKEQVDTKIWLGTLNGPEADHRMLYTRFNDYANLVLHDPDAERFVEGVSYQWAGKAAVAQTRRAFPEKKYIQSENECGDGQNTWEYARYIFEMFVHYITSGVCAYTYWNMVLPKEGESTWGWKQNSMITVSADKTVSFEHEYYVMKHFSCFVTPGAKRLVLSGHLCSNAVAFKNPDGTVVLTVQNPFARPLTFSFAGEVFTLSPDSFNTIVFDKERDI